MLNASPGLYNGYLPAVFLKEIAILPIEEEQEQMRLFKFVAKVMVQTTRNNYNNAFNLNVTAVTDLASERYLYREPVLRQQVYSNSSKSQNIKVENLSRDGSPLYYSATQQSRVYSKIVEVPFTLSSVGDLQHLSLLCFTSEISSTQESKVPNDLATNQVAFRVSRPVLERIITAGRPTTTAVIYKLLDTVPGYGNAGDVWSGPVHRHPLTGLMVEARHVDAPHPRVEAISTPNQKIKDYRTNKVNGLIANRNSLPILGGNYFSQIYYSRCTDGSIRVHTNFNFLKYVKEQSQMGYLFDNNQSLLATADLLDIKVFRNEVDVNNVGINTLTTGLKLGNNTLSTTSSRRLVATLADGNVKVVQTNNQAESKSVLPLVIIDSQIQDETEGTYHYEIEIEINDNASFILSNMVTDLENKIRISTSYEQKVNSYGRRNFNVDSNLLGHQSELNADTTWKEALRHYISILGFVYGSRVGRIPINLVARNLLGFAGPYAVTPESLAYFYETLNQFVEIMYNKILSKAVGNINKPQNFRSHIAGTSALIRKLKVISNFQDNYVNSLNRDTGFDYFGSAISTNPAGFSRLDYSSYQRRVNTEVQKYDVASPAAEGINAYGFLSPTQIRTSTITFDAGKNISLDNSLDLLNSNEENFTPSRNFKANPLATTATTTAMDSLLGQSDVFFEPKLVSLKDIKKTDPAKSLQVLDSAEFLCPSSEFARESLSAPAPISGSSLIKFKQELKNQKDFTSNQLLKSIVESHAAAFRPIRPVNQVLLTGSLAYTQVEKSRTSFDNLNVLEQNINFNSVVKIEYVVNGSNEWTLLTPGAFDLLQQSGVPVLCRFSQPNRILNIENKFELSPYDQLFVLGPAELPPLDVRDSVDVQLARVWENIQKTINQLFINNLNTKAAGGGVMSQYLTTPTAAQSPAPSQLAPRVATTTPRNPGNQGGRY